MIISGFILYTKFPEWFFFRINLHTMIFQVISGKWMIPDLLSRDALVQPDY